MGDDASDHSLKMLRLWRVVWLVALVAAWPVFASAQSPWKEEWDKTLRAAEVEGQVTLYGCCYDYDRVVEGFKKKYPKIKVATVLGSGNQLATRILAERRGEKYLPDVVSAGANTIHDALYKAHVLEPIKPALLLPEVQDQSKWFEGEHRYIDPEKRYIFAFVANSQSGQVIYNLKQVSPGEFKSYWNLVDPKWKGKMASLDPTSFGMGATLQFFYFHPELGPPFLKKLYGEMQVTVSRDARQMTDWLSAGKFALCIRCNAGSEVGKAVQQKLPIGYLDTEDWKEGGARAPPAAHSAFLTARPIPTRRRCSSTGFFRARVRPRCKNSDGPTRTTRAEMIFRKTTSTLSTAWSKGKNISISQSRNIKI